MCRCMYMPACALGVKVLYNSHRRIYCVYRTHVGSLCEWMHVMVLHFLMAFFNNNMWRREIIVRG